jgi:hypothetical protein
MIDALRHGGDLLNVFGDFPTLTDPRHADAYSPLWDAQLGLWTPKAVQEGLNTRQVDEVQVFNLAATRPDLLTGVNPATGQPEPYGSVGVDINCAVIGWSGSQPPTANLADPAPGSQFPPGRHTSPRRSRPCQALARLTGSLTRIDVPRPGWLLISIEPPIASTRSTSPVNPEPLEASAPPLPSSLTVSSSQPSRRLALSKARDASACLAVLVSASAAT